MNCNFPCNNDNETNVRKTLRENVMFCSIEFIQLADTLSIHFRNTAILYTSSLLFKCLAPVHVIISFSVFRKSDTVICRL